MNKSKENNFLRKYIKSSFKAKDIEKFTLTKEFINRIDELQLSSYSMSSFCCYSEDVPCWEDTEALHWGWIFNKKDLTHKDCANRIKDTFKVILKDIYNRNKRKTFYIFTTPYRTAVVAIGDMENRKLHFFEFYTIG